MQRYACLVIEVVEFVVVPTEFAVSCPDVGYFPVVDGVGVAYGVVYAACPSQTEKMAVIAVAVDNAPSIETLRGAYAYEAADVAAPFTFAQPVCEEHLKVVIP